MGALSATADTIQSGFAYVIATVHSGKQVQIDNIEFIERGFEDIVGKLRAVGINAQIV